MAAVVAAAAAAAFDQHCQCLFHACASCRRHRTYREAQLHNTLPLHAVAPVASTSWMDQQLWRSAAGASFRCQEPSRRNVAHTSRRLPCGYFCRLHALDGAGPECFPGSFQRHHVQHSDFAPPAGHPWQLQSSTRAPKTGSHHKVRISTSASVRASDFESSRRRRSARRGRSAASSRREKGRIGNYGIKIFVLIFF